MIVLNHQPAQCNYEYHIAACDITFMMCCINSLL